MTFQQSHYIIKDHTFPIKGEKQSKLTFSLAEIVTDEELKSEDECHSSKINPVLRFLKSMAEGKSKDVVFVELVARNEENSRIQFTLNMNQLLLWYITNYISCLEPSVRMHGVLQFVSGSVDPATVPIEHRSPVKDIMPSEESDTDYCEAKMQFSVDHQAPGGTDISCTFSFGLYWRQAPEKAKLNADAFMTRLLNDESTKDLTIVAGNGAELYCHRIVFSNYGKPLSAMISSRMKEGRLRKVELREYSEVGLQHLLNYLYAQELNVTQFSSDLAVELFEIAYKYQLNKLGRSLSQCFLIKDAEWFTPDAILELYFFVKNLDGEFIKRVENHVLLLMASMNIEELQSCEEFKKLDPGASSALVLKLQGPSRTSAPTPEPSSAPSLAPTPAPSPSRIQTNKGGKRKLRSRK